MYFSREVCVYRCTAISSLNICAVILSVSLNTSGEKDPRESIIIISFRALKRHTYTRTRKSPRRKKASPLTNHQTRAILHQRKKRRDKNIYISDEAKQIHEKAKTQQRERERKSGTEPRLANRTKGHE